MTAPGKLPIRDSIGAALRFARGNWRFVLAVAALGAGAHTLALAGLGSSLLWFPALIAISGAVHAVLTRAALTGAHGAPATLAADTGRTIAAGAIVGFFAAIIVLVLLYVSMAVLIAPYIDEAKTLLEDQAGLRALMERAVREQPAILSWTLGIGALIMLALTSRFYYAAPASLDRGRILVFESWRSTKGAMWRVMAARVVLLGPALVLVGALQSLAGMVVGVNGADPAAMAAQAQANPLAFLAFYGAVQFLQIAIYTSLEAGLSVSLYRAFQQQTPPPA